MSQTVWEDPNTLVRLPNSTFVSSIFHNLSPSEKMPGLPLSTFHKNVKEPIDMGLALPLQFFFVFFSAFLKVNSRCRARKDLIASSEVPRLSKLAFHQTCYTTLLPAALGGRSYARSACRQHKLVAKPGIS